MLDVSKNTIKTEHQTSIRTNIQNYLSIAQFAKVLILTPYRFCRQKKYVNPDLLDIYGRKRTYKDTQRNAQSAQKSTFWRPPGLKTTVNIDNK